MDRIAGYFSTTYTEARSKFLAAMAQGGARLLSSHTNPAKGPNGEDCVTDVAWIGPHDASKLLILVSGTHGAEGYAGSGCHVAWLQERWFERVAPKDTAVLLVHAINPHGFAWGRRVNEDNIDLNRNFVDHDRPRPENTDYVAIAEHIDPADWAEPGLTAHNRAIAQFLGRDRHDVMCKAMHGGQYVNPPGIFYGVGPTCGHHRLPHRWWRVGLLRPVHRRLPGRQPYAQLVLAGQRDFRGQGREWQERSIGNPGQPVFADASALA